MKSCDVDLSDSDAARLALRFDEEESRRVHVQKFMRFVRGEKSVALWDELWLIRWFRDELITVINLDNICGMLDEYLELVKI